MDMTALASLIQKKVTAERGPAMDTRTCALLLFNLWFMGYCRPRDQG